MIIGAFCGANSYMKRSVINNEIPVSSIAEDNDSCAVVTPEQAACVAKANDIHNALSV